MTQENLHPEDKSPEETLTEEESTSSDNPNPDEQHPEAMNIDELLKKQKAEEVDYKDKYLRLLAELENTRKRLQKEKKEMMRFSVENVISEFLQPIDNLEKAVQCTQGLSSETLNWVRGFQMIVAQLKDVISQNGVEEFTSLGAAFDPHIHEAVEVEELEDCIDGTILEEYVKGYKSNLRTVRPARVKVAKKKTTENN